MVATPTTVHVTDEARAYMADRGLDNNFPTLIDISEQVFRGASAIEVLLHEDPDIAGLRWLIVRVSIDLDTWERGREARAEWYTRTARELPPAFKTEFGLEIERRP